MKCTVVTSEEVPKGMMQAFIDGESPCVRSDTPAVIHWFMIKFPVVIEFENLVINAADDAPDCAQWLNYYVMTFDSTTRGTPVIKVLDGKVVSEPIKSPIRTAYLKVVKTFPPRVGENMFNLRELRVLGSATDQSAQEGTLFQDISRQGQLNTVNVKTNYYNQLGMKGLVDPNRVPSCYVTFLWDNPEIVVVLPRTTNLSAVILVFPKPTGDGYIEIPKRVILEYVSEGTDPASICESDWIVAVDTTAITTWTTRNEFQECEIPFRDVIEAKALRYRVGTGRCTMSLAKIDFRTLVGAAMSVPTELPMTFNGDGHRMIDFTLYESFGLLHLLEKLDLFKKPTNDGEEKETKWTFPCELLVKKLIVWSENGPTKVHMTVYQNDSDKQIEKVLFTRDVWKSTCIDIEEELWITGIKFSSSKSPIQFELFGAAKSEDLVYDISVNSNWFFRLRLNGKMGFFEAMRRLKMDGVFLYDTKVQKTDEMKFIVPEVAVDPSIVIFPASSFDPTYIFSDKEGDIEVSLDQETWDRIHLTIGITRVSCAPIKALRFLGELSLDNIDMFGCLLFERDRENPDTKPQIGRAYHFSYPVQNLCPELVPFVQKRCSGQLSINGYERLDVTPDLVILEHLYDFVMQVDTVVISTELFQLNDTSCRLFYSPSGVGPDREWQRLPCRSLPGAPGVYMVKTTSTVYATGIRLLGDPCAGVSREMMKVWGTIIPMETCKIHVHDNVYRFASFHPASCFMGCYQKITGKKLEIVNGRLHFDGITVSVEKIFVYNPAKSLIIKAVAHDNTESVIFKAPEREDSQYLICDIKNPVYAKSLLFSGPCEFFDFTGEVKSMADELVVSGPFLERQFCGVPSAGILDAMFNISGTLQGQLLVTVGPNISIDNNLIPTAPLPLQSDSLRCVFVGTEVLTTVICLTSVNHVSVASIQGDSEDIDFAEVLTAPDVTVLRLDCKKYYSRFKITTRTGPIVLQDIEFFGTVRAGKGVKRVCIQREQTFPFFIDKIGILGALSASGLLNIVKKKQNNGCFVFDFSEVSVSLHRIWFNDGAQPSCAVCLSDDEQDWTEVSVGEDGRCRDCARMMGRFVQISTDAGVSLDSIELFGSIFWDCEKPLLKCGPYNLILNPFNGLIRSGSDVKIYAGEFAEPLDRIVYNQMSSLPDLLSKYSKRCVCLDFGEKFFQVEKLAIEWDKMQTGEVNLAVLMSSDNETWDVSEVRIWLHDGNGYANLPDPMHCRYFEIIYHESGFFTNLEVFGSYGASDMPVPRANIFDVTSRIDVPKGKYDFDLLGALMASFDGLELIVEASDKRWDDICRRIGPGIRSEDADAGSELRITFPNALVRIDDITMRLVSDPVTDFTFETDDSGEFSRSILIKFKEDVDVSSIQLYGSYQRISVERPAGLFRRTHLALGTDMFQGILAFIGKSFDPTQNEFEIYPFLIEPDLLAVQGDVGARVYCMVGEAWELMAEVNRTAPGIYRAPDKDMIIHKIRIEGVITKLELFGHVQQANTGNLVKDPSLGLFSLIDTESMNVVSNVPANANAIKQVIGSSWQGDYSVLEGPSPKVIIELTYGTVDVEALGISLPTDHDTKIVIALKSGTEWVTVFDGSAKGIFCYKLPVAVNDVSGFTLSSPDKKISVNGIECYGTIDTNSQNLAGMKVYPKCKSLMKCLFKDMNSLGFLKACPRIFQEVPNNLLHLGEYSYGRCMTFAVDSREELKVRKSTWLALSGVYMKATAVSNLSLYGIQEGGMVKLVEWQTDCADYFPVRILMLCDSLVLIGKGEIEVFDLFGEVLRRPLRPVLPAQIGEGPTIIRNQGLMFNGILAATLRTCGTFNNSSIVRCCTCDSQGVPALGSLSAFSNVLLRRLVFSFAPHYVRLSMVAVQLANPCWKNDGEVLVVRFRGQQSGSLARVRGPFLENEIITVQFSPLTIPSDTVEVELLNTSNLIGRVEFFGSILLSHVQQAPSEVDVMNAAKLYDSIKNDIALGESLFRISRKYMVPLNELVSFAYDPKADSHMEALATFRDELVILGFKRNVTPSTAARFRCPPL